MQICQQLQNLCRRDCIVFLGAQSDIKYQIQFYKSIDNKTLLCTKTQIISFLRWILVFYDHKFILYLVSIKYLHFYLFVIITIVKQLLFAIIKILFLNSSLGMKANHGKSHPIHVFWKFKICSIPKGLMPTNAIKTLSNVWFPEFMLVSREIICMNGQANLIKNLDKAIKATIEINLTVQFKAGYVQIE